MDESKLTELFAKLGARDPAGWARSQTKEGIPQLARFLFLRQAWRCVVPPGDETWVERELKTPQNKPGGIIVAPLRRLIDGGASIADLTIVVRVMQWQLLFQLCYLLGDPGDVEEEVKNIEWCLFQTDDEGNPLIPIDALHESVLDTAPDDMGYDL
jgi:hypothetical protein